MIQLKGQIRVQRLAGKINMVPAEGGGGPLQAKTAYPSHSEQIIAPDDDYYGLVAVTVKPVPRLPAAVASVYEGIPNTTLFETVVSISTGSSVTWEKYYTHFYYNGVRLPVIPEDVLAEYPYAWIRNNTTSGYYDLVLAAYPWYFSITESKTGIYCSGGESMQEPWYQISIATAEAATEWTFNKNATGWFSLDSARTVLWSNHDIPNGSADATDIYFEGTDPVPTD